MESRFRIPDSRCILVVDDEPQVADYCRSVLEDAGHSVLIATSAEEAHAILRQHLVHVLLTDLRMPNGDGVDLLRRVRIERPGVDVILMTAFGTIETAVSAFRSGVHDFLEKPFSPDRLTSSLRQLKAPAPNPEWLPRTGDSEGCADGRVKGIVGDSREIRDLNRAILRLAGRTQPVLITGETGTGKELVARAIHEHGSGRNAPFIAVDCGALSPALIESELFGHVRGAFTGSYGDRKGLLECSAGGTLFLDEVGELPISMQAKLLRVLQDREFRPLGSDKTRKFSARVLSATNRRLPAAVGEGVFRADLLYRLNVLSIEVPRCAREKGISPCWRSTS